MISKHDEYLNKYKAIYSGTQKLISEGTTRSGEMYGDGLMFVKKVMIFVNYIITKKDRAVTILDYGCGRAMHTHKRDYNMSDRFKNITIFELFKGMIQCYYCYDPAVRRYSTKPTPGTQFDLVAIPDVLEHVPEEGLESVIADAASFLKKDGLLVATIGGLPARCHFANEDGSIGENLHCTLKPLVWWIDLFHTLIPDRSFVIIYEDDKLEPRPGLPTNVCMYSHSSPHFNLNRNHFNSVYWVDK